MLARDLKLNLYRIDLSAAVSKYIGETEKNLRRVSMPRVVAFAVKRGPL